LALIGAIAAVVVTIIAYPYLLTIFSPEIDVEKVNIDLANVSLQPESSEQELTLQVTFTLVNNNEVALTTSKIEYELFADGTTVGTDILSYEDIPVNGRPALFSGSPVPLRDFFVLKYSDDEAALFNTILTNSTQLNWRVTGSATIESGTIFVPKEFSAEL
jgi:hypothetical protein